MVYTKVGPFTNNSATPPIDKTFLDGVETALRTATGGPNYVSADTAGVLASGSDVSAALTALLSGITTYTQVRLPSGNINLGTASYSIDVSKVSLLGERTKLTGTGTITLFSTQNYYARQTVWGDALKGVTLSGINLTIGGSDSALVNGMFHIRDGGMLNGTLTFGSNAWKIHFDLFHLTGTTVTAPSTSTNSGEDMVWRDSLLGDGTTINLATNGGDWHFSGCSFDNMTLTASGTTLLHLNSCHFEANGGSSARLLSISGSGTTAVLTGCTLVLDAGTGNWTMAPFYVDPGVINGGIIIRGMQVPLHTYYLPETTDKIRVLVAGGGYADVQGITTYDTSDSPYALTETGNLIRNGDAEESTAVGYGLYGTGSYVRDTTYKNRGGASHKIQCATGQNETIYFPFAIQAGKKLWFQVWQSFTATSGSSLNSQVDFYDSANSFISTANFDSLTATVTPRWKTGIALVPRGATSARFTFYLVGGSSGTASMNVDDIIVNAA